MAWSFDPNCPIYAQLTERLRLRIASGEYPPGCKLPAVRELAADAGANPNTVQRAFAELEREGLIFTQRTSGRFVTEDPAMVNAARRTLAGAQVEAYFSGMASLGYEAAEAAAMVAEKANQQIALEKKKEES